MAHGVPSRLALICCNRKSLEVRLFCLLRFVRAGLLTCSDFGMKICLVFSGEAAGVHFECWRRMFKSWALLKCLLNSPLRFGIGFCPSTIHFCKLCTCANGDDSRMLPARPPAEVRVGGKRPFLLEARCKTAPRFLSQCTAPLLL